MTVEVSKKEEEDPRIFFLPLGTKELYKVHVKNDHSLAIPSAFSTINVGKLLNTSLWIFSLPRRPASLSLRFPRKCQLKHVAPAACIRGLGGSGRWPSFWLSARGCVLRCLGCDCKCSSQRQVLRRLYQVVNMNTW